MLPRTVKSFILAKVAPMTLSQNCVQSMFQLAGKAELYPPGITCRVSHVSRMLSWNENFKLLSFFRGENFCSEVFSSPLQIHIRPDYYMMQKVMA